jgi:hypothetical protein
LLRNPDEDLRRLERAARAGDPRARAAWIREQVRRRHFTSGPLVDCPRRLPLSHFNEEWVQRVVAPLGERAIRWLDEEAEWEAEYGRGLTPGAWDLVRTEESDEYSELMDMIRCHLGEFSFLIRPFGSVPHGTDSDLVADRVHQALYAYVYARRPPPGGVQQNPDERMRRWERHARAGDPGAMKRLERERIRAHPLFGTLHVGEGGIARASQLARSVRVPLRAPHYSVSTAGLLDEARRAMQPPGLPRGMLLLDEAQSFRPYSLARLHEFMIEHGKQAPYLFVVVPHEEDVAELPLWLQSVRRISSNPDEDLRRLERRAAGGDPEAEAALRRARTRTTGRVPMSHRIGMAQRGVFTPWAEVLCLRCANEPRIKQSPGPALDIEGKGIARCDRCGVLVAVRDDVALLQQLRDALANHGIPGVLAQTGGMCASLQIGMPPELGGWYYWVAIDGEESRTFCQHEGRILEGHTRDQPARYTLERVMHTTPSYHTTTGRTRWMHGMGGVEGGEIGLTTLHLASVQQAAAAIARSYWRVLREGLEATMARAEYVA